MARNPGPSTRPVQLKVEEWAGGPERVPSPKNERPVFVGTGRVEGLREKLDTSIFLLVKISIEIHNLGHGQRLICMDSERLPEELGLGKEAIQGLLQAGLVRVRPQKPRRKERIDYAALQQTYRRMLSMGPISSQTELARHLGVSRVWVSRVLKGIKRKAG